jgi:hypothetical protein
LSLWKKSKFEPRGTDGVGKPVEVNNISPPSIAPMFARDIGNSRARLRTLEKLVNKVKLLANKKLRDCRLCRNVAEIGLENARDFFIVLAV